MFLFRLNFYLWNFIWGAKKSKTRHKQPTCCHGISSFCIRHRHLCIQCYLLFAISEQVVLNKDKIKWIKVDVNSLLSFKSWFKSWKVCNTRFELCDCWKTWLAEELNLSKVFASSIFQLKTSAAIDIFLEDPGDVTVCSQCFRSEIAPHTDKHPNLDEASTLQVLFHSWRHPGVSGPDNDRTIFPTSLCGPKFSGPDNDCLGGRCLVLVVVWSCYTGPGNRLHQKFTQDSIGRVQAQKGPKRKACCARSRFQLSTGYSDVMRVRNSERQNENTRVWKEPENLSMAAAYTDAKEPVLAIPCHNVDHSKYHTLQAGNPRPVERGRLVSFNCLTLQKSSSQDEYSYANVAQALEHQRAK